MSQRIMLTWAEIDLEAIKHNLNQIKAIVEPEGSKVLAVIKDNAYGHGALEVAQVAQVGMFGVATVEEAIKLRQGNVKTPILIFCCVLPEQAETVVQYDIAQTICDLDVCKSLSDAAKRFGKVAKVHIKVDTGMGRIGIAYDKAVEFIKQVLQIPHIAVEGIYTHFASADTDREFTELQIDRFRSVISYLNEIGIHIPIRHAANSAGVLNFPSAYFDMVRPGLAIYGLYPCDNPVKQVELKPALSLKTRVVYLKELPAGHSVSYGRTYITNKPNKVATLAIGYGHGYNRKLSNKGEVLIKGKRAQIIGLICMDQCLCDVTDIPDVSVGDEVVLIGKQGDEQITADEIADKIGTISYEVVCGIHSNVPRIYKS
jgi:alanine racemase